MTHDEPRYDIQDQIDAIGNLNIDAETKKQMAEKMIKDHGYDDDALKSIITRANL